VQAEDFVTMPLAAAATFVTPFAAMEHYVLQTTSPAALALVYNVAWACVHQDKDVALEPVTCLTTTSVAMQRSFARQATWTAACHHPLATVYRLIAPLNSVAMAPLFAL